MLHIQNKLSLSSINQPLISTEAAQNLNKTSGTQAIYAQSVILHTVPLDHLIPIAKYFVYIINVFVKHFVYISDRGYPNNLISEGNETSPVWPLSVMF